MAATAKPKPDKATTADLEARKRMARKEIADKVDALSVGVTPKREALIRAYLRLKAEQVPEK